MNKIKIGIIGLGFVGTAIKNAYDKNNSVELVLKDEFKNYNATYNDLLECSAIFIAVPSPQGDDGRCDTSILESVLLELNDINYKGVIISKVTAPPLEYKELHRKYNSLVHAPEFLTAVNANDDYINGEFSIIGGSIPWVDVAKNIILLGQPNITTTKFCTIEEASLAKYSINCFLATKVIFMNELEDYSNVIGCDYNVVSNLIKSDKRIGTSHMQVPGPDGEYGFGGYCFPKDTSALYTMANDADVGLMVLQAVIEANTLIRLIKK